MVSKVRNGIRNTKFRFLITFINQTSVKKKNIGYRTHFFGSGSVDVALNKPDPGDPKRPYTWIVAGTHWSPHSSQLRCPSCPGSHSNYNPSVSDDQPKINFEKHSKLPKSGPKTFWEYFFSIFAPI